MTHPFLDTDVLIRLLTGDDLEKQAQAATLFEQVEAGLLTVGAPDTVIADAVYVLSSPRLYRVPRSEVRALLTPLARLPHFRVNNRSAVCERSICTAVRAVWGSEMLSSSLRWSRGGPASSTPMTGTSITSRESRDTSRERVRVHPPLYRSMQYRQKDSPLRNIHPHPPFS